MEKNPFRYRGYYYDRETGFYYLQSRYYNPWVDAQDVTHTTDYALDGSTILSEKVDAGTAGEYTLYYYYDAAGKLRQIGYKAGSGAETYYFMTRNAQGDIIALYSCASSTLVGTYTYDAWGEGHRRHNLHGSQRPDGKEPLPLPGLTTTTGKPGFYYHPVALLQPGDPQVPQCG